MTIRTHLKAGGWLPNHNEALQVRSLKAGDRPIGTNHNEALQVRSTLKAGGTSYQHNEVLQVRSALKAGGLQLGNHNEALQVRTSLKAGGIDLPNHNEALRRKSGPPAISMRRQPRTTGRKADRLELLVVRAGLRAGKRGRR
jgi:hypothetical protein